MLWDNPPVSAQRRAGTYTSHLDVTTDLDSPKDLRVTHKTEDTITVEWKRPLAAIDRYFIIYVTGSGAMNEVVVPADAVSYILTGLKPAAEYNIILIALRGNLKSIGSTTSASTGKEDLSVSPLDTSSSVS